MDDRTKEVLDALFEFKLAEVVYFCSARDLVIGRDTATGYVITERRLQQCSGGLQMAYLVGGKVHHQCELTRDRPTGRRITDEEAEDIRAYREKTQPRIDWDPLFDKAKDDAKGTS